MRILNEHTTIKADFEGDLRRVFTFVLAQHANLASRQALESMPVSTLVIRYLNWRHRLITPRPRLLRLSREFTAAQAKPEYAGLLSPLLDKIARGGDLTPHLSTGIRHVFKHQKKPRRKGRPPDFDFLLNDWGIHHLHLSDRIVPGTGFTERDGPLLFAIFRPEVAFLIDVLGHGEWANEHLFRVMVTNWPDDQLALQLNVSGLAAGPTHKERQKLREAGCLVLVEVDGRAYVPAVTLGVTTAGTSVQASREAADFLRTIGEMERRCREQLDFVVSLYLRAGLPYPSHPWLRLASLEDGWGIVDNLSCVLLWHF